MAALPGDKGNPPAARGPGGAPRPRWAAGERLPPPDFGVNPGEGEGEGGDEGSQHSPDEDLVPTDDDTDEDEDLRLLTPDATSTTASSSSSTEADAHGITHAYFVAIHACTLNFMSPHLDITTTQNS